MFEPQENVRREVTAERQFAEIKAASALHPNSGAWTFFMREIIRLPREMTPAVRQVIRLERWKSEPDPLEAIRSDALDAHRAAWAKQEILIAPHRKSGT